MASKTFKRRSGRIPKQVTRTTHYEPAGACISISVRAKGRTYAELVTGNNRHYLGRIDEHPAGLLDVILIFAHRAPVGTLRAMIRADKSMRFIS